MHWKLASEKQLWHIIKHEPCDIGLKMEAMEEINRRRFKPKGRKNWRAKHHYR